MSLLVTLLLVINIIFFIGIIFLIRMKKSFDPLMLSLLGNGNPETLLMMKALDGKSDVAKMMLIGRLMKSREQGMKELKREVIEEVKPIIKDALKKEIKKELKEIL